MGLLREFHPLLVLVKLQLIDNVNMLDKHWHVLACLGADV